MELQALNRSQGLRFLWATVVAQTAWLLFLLWMALQR